MEFKEVKLNEEIASELINLSLQWEKEKSCYGYCRNDIDDIAGNRVFVAYDNDNIIGYLFGHKIVSKNMGAVVPDGKEMFEVVEFYVQKEYRSKGVGKKLWSYVEKILKKEKTPYMILSTATKNYKAIFHFYIEEVGMNFWKARLFKKIL